ncbi:MAG TPA: HAD hydrolase-like protein [Steroidobacteraceae bacterium]|nr:HAD hydrolase-like protein [Steroidobacteraceae bacterium]
MNYKLAIFDFDGTLANTFPFFLESFNTLAEKYKFKKVDQSEIESLRGEGARTIIKHVGLPMWKVPFVGAHFKKLMAASVHRIQPFDGAGVMLTALHQQGIKLSLATSNSGENVSRILGAETAGLFHHSSFNTSMFGKRAALRRVLRNNSIAHHEAIYIGDELRDLEAAHAERIAFGAVAWGYTKPDALRKHQPAATFHTMADISELLARDA